MVLMKTTFEVPDDLYREVKSQAALRGKKIKDYVAEGLRLVLAADRDAGAGRRGPISVFAEIRREPLHLSAEVEQIIERSDSERKARWRDEV